MGQATVNINRKDFILRQSFAALVEFEKLTGKNLCEISTSLSDEIAYFYAMLKGANVMTFDYTYDGFLEVMDDNPELLSQFRGYLVTECNIPVDENGQIRPEAFEKAKESLSKNKTIYKQQRQEYKAKLN